MEILEALKGRRSIAYFDPAAEVPRAALEELLAVAALAPSSMNLQPWKVVAVVSPERKAALRACAMNQAKVEEASATLIIIADPDALEENIGLALDWRVKDGSLKPEAVEKQKGFALRHYGPPDGERRKIFAVKNACFFAMSLMAAARGFGLETHPMDGFDEDKLKAEFGIPAGKIVPLLVTVGRPRPGAELKPRAWRRPAAEFTRFE